MLRKKLYEARKSSKLMVHQIAAKVGVSVRMYHYIESGKRDPSLKVANKLADLFRTEPRELLEVDSNTEGR